MESSNFIQFSGISNPELVNKFLRNITSWSEFSKPCKILSGVLSEYRKKLNIKLADAPTLPGIYLVMIVGSSDELLIKLANSCGFPRGFPIIWVPDASVRFYGFYPKFDNDTKGAIKGEFTIPQNAASLDINFKYSGSLFQLVCFEFAGSNYWTTCSKNSPDNEFAGWARGILEPSISADLVKEVVRSNLVICGEMMSKNDQTHGSVVSKEACVVTLVGAGSYANSNGTTSGVETFMIPLNSTQTLNFCRTWKLGVDSIYQIRGDIKQFIQILGASRDFLDYPMFMGLVEKLKGICELGIDPGSVNYCEILGKVLEGFIFKFRDNSGAVVSILKFKLPPYTIRTFLFRDVIKKRVDMGSKKFRYLLNSYVNNWTSLYPDYWLYQGMLAASRSSEILRTYEPASNIGQWIYLCDRMMEFAEYPYNPEFDYKAGYRALADASRPNISTQANVVVITGPPGYPTEDVARGICQIKPDKFVYAPPAEDLSSNRQAKTFRLIEQLVQQGKVPVMPIDLNVLCDAKGLKMQKSVPGLSLTLIIPVLGQGAQANQSAQLLENYTSENSRELYKSKESFDEIWAGSELPKGKLCEMFAKSSKAFEMLERVVSSGTELSLIAQYIGFSRDFGGFSQEVLEYFSLF